MGGRRCLRFWRSIYSLDLCHAEHSDTCMICFADHVPVQVSIPPRGSETLRRGAFTPLCQSDIS